VTGGNVTSWPQQSDVLDAEVTPRCKLGSRCFGRVGTARLIVDHVGLIIGVVIHVTERRYLMGFI
jgi:hypothetical protein